MVAACEERVFNKSKRPFRRTHIPLGETAAAVVILAALGLAAAWYASKARDFDPSERDIATELLVAGSVTDTLYRTPVQRWAEPGQAMGASAAPALGVFPAALLDNGWEPTSRVQEFNKETLYEKIDGAAEQYFQFGFKMLHYVALGKPAEDLEISVELYDMESFQNALGIFAAQKDAGRSTERIGRAQCYTTGAGVIGLFDNYYFKLAGNSGTPAIHDKARQMTEALSQISTDAAATTLPFLAFTEKLGIPLERISYEKQDVFQYDFAGDFWFAQAAAESDLRYYIHAAKNPEDAAALFDNLLQNHVYDYDVVEKSERRAVLKHKYLGTFLTLECHAELVFGLDNAPDQAALEAPSRALLAALDVEAPAREQ
jgi:hypothetical protein